MAFDGLTIIGESINDSVPSTNALYEAGDFDGISELARFQEDGGAKYIDVNVGVRSPETMAKAVKAVLASTHVPVSIDSPDYALAEAGLRAYDPSRGKPILNSISPLRTEMFNLYSITPFRPILLLTERIDESGESVPSRTVDDVYSAAARLTTSIPRPCFSLKRRKNAVLKTTISSSIPECLPLAAIPKAR